jgi:ribosomal protein S18 acetylase RimI-like enzyme
MPTIDRLGTHQLNAAALTLAKAFHTDPMFEWIFPDPSERSRALAHLNRVPLAYALRQGRPTQSDGVKAVAVWMPPGRAVTPVGMIRAGMLAVPFRVGFRPFARFMGAMDAMEKIHKRHVAQPHWYLMIVGVDTELQGQGRGAALVKEGLERADGETAPCYLETSQERNLPFYERLGFRIVESAHLGRGGPEAWAMLREAFKPKNTA